MQLKRIKLKNFRAYDDFQLSITNGLQMLVGKNDIGKSTIFEALDVFFNDKEATIKISIDDLNISARIQNNLTMAITCCFTIDPTDKITVETVAIDPKEEYLLNANGELEIIKEWDLSLQTPKFNTYIVCCLPKSVSPELLTAKQADLKKKVKELNIEKNVNQTINSSMRKGIISALISENDSFQETRIPTKNMLCEKDIFDNISKALPDFYLFKADRKNSTSDDEIQNPMSIAVKRAFELDEVKTKIDEIQSIIIKELNEVNTSTIKKLEELNIEYGNTLNARITTNWTSAIKNDIIDGNNIPINKRGSGIRRLLLLSYLMVEAEKKSFYKNKRNIIFAIEEPETALHPMMQKKFIEQLLSLSKANRFEFGDETPSNADELRKYQVFITTHLPNFVSYADCNQIIYLYKVKEKVERYKGENLKKFIQDEMGKIPVIDYKYIVFVEGENDVSALRHFGKIPELKSIFDINSSSINIIPLKGSNLLKCIELEYYWDLPVKQYHLYDGDVSKYKTEIIDKKCNKDDNKKVRGTVTSLKEMENYIPRALIEVKLGLDLDLYADKWNNFDFDIVNTLLSQRDTSVPQFNNIKHMTDSKEKEKALKQYLSKTVLAGVTKELLEHENLYSEIESWFKNMKSLYDYVE